MKIWYKISTKRPQFSEVVMTWRHFYRLPYEVINDKDVSRCRIQTRQRRQHTKLNIEWSNPINFDISHFTIFPIDSLGTTAKHLAAFHLFTCWWIDWVCLLIFYGIQLRTHTAVIWMQLWGSYFFLATFHGILYNIFLLINQTQHPL